MKRRSAERRSVFVSLSHCLIVSLSFFDMDDNGMSRYMDNYDEEGWD